MDGLPIRQELNNGILNSTKAMPLKDITSDNTASFALNRTLFNNSYQPPVNFAIPQVSRTIVQRTSPAIHNGFIIDGPKTTQQKKWIGGNRDASQTAMRRRMGTAKDSTGPQSFVNIRDPNTYIQALARVRGGGSRVPVKVGGRNLLPPPEAPVPTYYRIISAGWNATSGSTVINRSASSAYGLSVGFYTYTLKNTVGTSLYTIGRSYNVMTINRVTGANTFSRFDVFDGTGTAAFVSFLNALTSSVIVVVATFDEPQSSGALTPLPAGVISAMQRCGASSNFGSANDSPPKLIQYRGAYILVGIPGAGVGTGIQRDAGTVTNDPNAYLDLRIGVLNGEYTYISG